MAGMGRGMAARAGGRGLAGRVVPTMTPTARTAALRRAAAVPGDYFLSPDDQYGADARAARREKMWSSTMAPRGSQPPLRRRPQTALPPVGKRCARAGRLS